MFIFYLIYFFLMPTYVYAYLDPGTGSLLLYALIGIFTSILFLFKRFFYLIKSKILGGSIETSQSFDIVIHSEGTRYYHIFEPLINVFLNEQKKSEYKHKLTFISPDLNDPASQINDENFEFLCPGNEYKTIALLNNLKANIVISTTPDLDVYMWKKSKKVKKYIHIFHSPNSVDFYERYSLSFYDVIINVFEDGEKAQKFLDKKRNLPEKQYFTAGCTYLDTMYNQVKQITRTETKKTILYAPSWGERSSINTFGIEIIQNLINSGYKVIFRPHPQSYISDKEKIEFLISNFENNELFQIDKNKTGLIAMVNSDALISDFSGILLDYYCLFNKPIFLASANLNIKGYEIEDLPPELQFDLINAKKISTELSEQDISNISYLVTKKISDVTSNENEKIIPNIGSASEQIYRFIIQILGEL